MRCKRHIRRFKTEPVAYLKTQARLLAVEHGKPVFGHANVQVVRFAGQHGETRTPVFVSGHNNRSLARLSDYGS
jgi:hypothetical protein